MHRSSSALNNYFETHICVKNPDEIRPMWLFHFSDSVYYLIFYPVAPPENCTWPAKMVASQVAPYPSISCVFEDGIVCGPPSVPLEAIAGKQISLTTKMELSTMK